ncbi:MAG: NAD-dependent epimerase [Bacteroidetes bacterium]|nr:NAD-dependent epimerase [Bacteroidota bacterium]
MKVLVTGAAGFIGYHLSKLLTSHDYEVVGLDAINDYYDVNLKYSRLQNLGINKENITYGGKVSGIKNFSFYQAKLEDNPTIQSIFNAEKCDVVINLAAQAGVRYSIENPYAYVESNIVGFINVLEACRANTVKHLIYASSSSVYGLNKTMPFAVKDNVDHPISLYAASKKSNELMAHTYSYLFNLPTTGLRFFTVYGPWGRPDMALFIFTKAIINGEPISVFNNGNMQRDFTYVADIVESIRLLIPQIPTPNADFNGENPDPSISLAPYRVHNIGNNSPVKLMDFITEIEDATGKKAIINFKEIQPGDVPATYADVTSLFNTINFKPKTNIKDGVREFVNWYKEYYKA